MAEFGNLNSIHDAARPQQGQVEGRAVVGYELRPLGEEIDREIEEWRFAGEIVHENLRDEKIDAFEKADSGEEGDRARSPGKARCLEIEE